MNLIATMVLIASAGIIPQDGFVLQQQADVQPTATAAPLDYTTAYSNAMQGDKPLLILVTADWCPPCQVMKSTTIPQLMANNAFRDFHYATVDIDMEREVGMQLIGERGLPQLIMFEKEDDKWMRRYLRGIQTPEAVEAFVAQANIPRTAEIPNDTTDK